MSIEDIVFTLSFALPFGYWVLLGIVYIGQKMIAWVDDSEPGHNIIIKYLMTKVFGYHCTGSEYCFDRYKQGDLESSGDLALFMPILVLALMPVTVQLILTFYSVSITLLVFALVMYLARYVRRLQKKFDSHCSDGNAHK